MHSILEEFSSYVLLNSLMRLLAKSEETWHFSSLQIREKERKALEDKEAGAADVVRRQKLLASLPSTFDMILLIYQSLNRTVMTKQELIYKIIANHSKITDRGRVIHPPNIHCYVFCIKWTVIETTDLFFGFLGEVEEQLKLLQELVPDWISEKTALSGDLLCWWAYWTLCVHFAAVWNCEILLVWFINWLLSDEKYVSVSFAVKI